MSTRGRSLTSSSLRRSIRLRRHNCALVRFGSHRRLRLSTGLRRHSRLRFNTRLGSHRRLWLNTRLRGNTRLGSHRRFRARGLRPKLQGRIDVIHGLSSSIETSECIDSLAIQLDIGSHNLSCIVLTLRNRAGHINESYTAIVNRLPDHSLGLHGHNHMIIAIVNDNLRVGESKIHSSANTGKMNRTGVLHICLLRSGTQAAFAHRE